jgi:hypothetical protein
MVDFYYLDKIEYDSTGYINEILKIKLEDQTDFHVMKKYSLRFSEKRKSNSTKLIIDMVFPFFEKAGLTINPNNGYIYYESYEYNSTKYIDTPFDITFQNEEMEDVHVCYLITQKDENLKGGNLDVYKEYTLLNMIGYKKEEKIEVPLETGNIIIMSGDTLYKHQGCSGSGTLNLIRVVFYKNKRFGYSYDNDDD